MENGDHRLQQHHLPVGGLGFIPAFEEVLDTTPTVSTATANVFTLTNNNDGPFKDFKIQFESNLNDFTYAPDGKPSGTITFVFLRAPDGSFIASAGPGTTGFGNNKLQDFYASLTSSAAATPKDAIFNALNSLFSKTNTVNGSNVADHLSNFGSAGGQINAGAGDDILSSRGAATMVGEAGNDVFRLSSSTYNVHGANADGSGGAGETNTVEVRGTAYGSVYAEIKSVSDIDVLRFIDTDPAKSTDSDSTYLSVTFDAKDLRAGGLSPTLKVFGSEAASPFSENSIRIQTGNNVTNGQNIDLSGWTFSNWDERDSNISINTGGNLALDDVIVGSDVRDDISTGSGNDIIRGGKGADYLSGGRGNDTFVFGTNEAGVYENIYGGEDTDTDRMLILGDNDFSEAYFGQIDVVAFGGAATATFNQYLAGGESPIKTVEGDGHANTLAVKIINYGEGPPAVDLSKLAFTSWSANDKVTITGTEAADTIAGSVMGDVIDGGLGNDDLQGNAGADTFVFSINARGVDHIADFLRKEGDKIGLDGASFSTLKGGGLSKKAFAKGDEAEDRKDRIIYDQKDGTLRYDDDGSGKHKAVIIGILDDAAKLKAGDILVI